MLEGLEKILEALRTFDNEEVLKEIISEGTETIADLQRDQWLEGRGGDGEYIRPYYSENPYFKTPEAAARYARWKQKITPNPQRPIDVPNLKINGYLHDSMFAELSGEEVIIDSDVSFATDVFNTHLNARGLSPEKRKLFAETVTLPKFADILFQKTGLKMK